MTTVEIGRPGTFARGGESAAGETSSGAAILLLAALSLLILYAAFDHGAISISAQARVQAALSVIAAVAAAVWVWSGALRLAVRPMALAGLGALAAFAVWSGVTVVWSVAPDQTWLEFNRALTYVLALGVALLAGASHRRSIEVLANGALLVAFAVTLYALGQKVLPGFHVPGLFNLNQTQLVPRLQEPFGYWNALGLFVAFGVPIGLAVAVDSERLPRVRLAGLAAVELMLITVGLTYSRGALLAVVCGLIVGVGLSGARLRSLLWLALAAVAMVAPLVLSLTDHVLTDVSVSLARRERAGLVLLAVLVASLVALWLAGKRVIELESRVRMSPEVSRRIGQLLAGALAVALIGGVIAVSVSSRGLTGTVSHAVDSFTTREETSDLKPSRLLSVASQNRVVWWKEAVGAFSDRPLAGWGAGSFPVVHLVYRRNSLSVKQPHSVPLQWLAETGIIGALLAIGAYGLLTAAGVGSVRRKEGSERLIAASLLAVVVIYGIHALFDWDWDIPGVTLPVLVAVGVLVGSDRLGTARSVRSRQAGAPLPTRVPAAGPAARTVTLLALAGALCAAALSGVVPSLAAGRASAALVAATSSSGSALKQARADAAEATRLNPFSDAGLVASATIAIRTGQNMQARTYLLRAVKRDPHDVRAWQRLTVVDLALGLTAGTFNAIQHVVALDPKGAEVEVLPKQVELLLTPPSGSATSRPSPAAGS